MTRYDLVVFDLDGTLADTKDDLAAATNHTMREMGLPTFDVAKVASFVGGGLTLLLKRALGPVLAEDAAAVERATEIFKPWYREHMLDATRLYPGIAPLLASLAGAGCKMSIATNKPRMFTAGIVSALLDGKFDPVIACADDAPRKPDPTCVRLCEARHPKIPRERIVFVGDTLVDVETAKNAGVDVISCSWGYAKREALVTAGPEHLVDRVESIGGIVLSQGGSS